MGRNIALIFEKTSTRTRSAFEVGAHDQGAHVTYLGPDESQLGHKESMKDTARVLGRMFDGIEYRGFAQEKVETLAALRRGAGLERADRPVAPDPDAGRRPHDARPRRHSRSKTSPTATSATPATTRRTRCSSPARCSASTSGSPPRGALADQPRSARSPSRLATSSGARLTVTDDVARGGRWSRLPLHRRLAVDGRAGGGVGRAHRASSCPTRSTPTREGDAEPGGEVPALPPGPAQPRHRGRRDDLRQVGSRRPRGHRRGLRVASLDRLRPGREPAAHDQGGHGRHARRAEVRIVVALGGNALLERGETPDAEIQEHHILAGRRGPCAACRATTTWSSPTATAPRSGLLALESDADPALSHAYPLDVLGRPDPGNDRLLARAGAGQRRPEPDVRRTGLPDRGRRADDPAFAHPTKFVGQVYSEARAEQLATDVGLGGRDRTGPRGDGSCPRPSRARSSSSR